MQIKNTSVSLEPYILENGHRNKIPKGMLMIIQGWDPSGPNDVFVLTAGSILFFSHKFLKKYFCCCICHSKFVQYLHPTRSF